MQRGTDSYAAACTAVARVAVQAVLVALFASVVAEADESERVKVDIYR